MRVTGIWTAIGAVIFGVILADLVTHQAGTQVLANSAASVEKVSVNGLLGQTS
jgi:hypothetical protein